ncbi:MAG TPA: hypothetical protein VIL55_07160 [Naasia sp.]|jgi:hypothetical protein
MAFFRRSEPSEFPKDDAGSGSLNDYRYDLLPRNGRVKIRLAGSDAAADLLRPLIGVEDIATAGGQRTPEEERTDAPMDIRLFADRRILGPVGRVPRGLEAAVAEALSRLESSGRKARIPVEVVDTKHGPRVDLLMGQTR